MMRGDLSFGEDEESRVGREVELGTAEPENRQSEDRENVIEMTQEDGLPAEEPAAKRPEKPEKPEKVEKPAKSGKVFWKVVMAVVLLLLIVGSMIAGAFWQRKEDEKNLLEGGAEVAGETLKAEAEADKAVREVVGAAKLVAEKYLTMDEMWKRLEVVLEYDTIFPVYRPEGSNVWQALEKSYGFGVFVPGYSEMAGEDVRGLVVGNSKYQAAIRQFLTERGFEELTNDYAIEYMNRETGVLCSLGQSGGEFACGNINWRVGLNAEVDQQLIKGYKDALATEHDFGDAELSVGVVKARKSQYAPYQYLETTISVPGANGGAVAAFYRANPEAEWRYFTSFQDAGDCSRYNTEDLRKAFAGSWCYDDEGALVNVEP